MKVLFCTCIVALLTCASVWAQATAQIHGTVQDASGSAVPGADVKATQTQTGAVRTTTSGPDGGYVFTNLPLGPYEIEVSKQGFTTYVQSGITLQVNGDVAVNASLKVGAVSEQVVVEANASQVETRSSGVGSVVQTQQIVDLPLNGRNVTDLITLSGTAVNFGNIRSSFFSNLPMIAIAGQPASGEPIGTEYTLDGANHVDFLTETTMPIAFPDAVQEFKVESSGETAQHGATALIAVVTPSGTNAFHGDAFEFLRNSGFGSAREFFSTTSSPYIRNQFGGTVGGPIKKNKIFFFAGLQGTTLRYNPDNSISTVPTQAMLQGNWTTFASPACNAGATKTLKAPFVNDQISPSLYNPVALYIVNKTLASLGGLQPNQCGVITYNTPDDENDLQGVARGDYQISDKQTVFLRALDTHYHIANSFSITPNLLTAASTGLDQLGQDYAIGDTYIISSNLVQSFRAGYERTASNNIQNHSYSFCQAGAQNFWCGANPDELGAVNISGGFQAGGTNGATGAANYYMNSLSVNDDLSWIKGSHQMAFGFGFLHGEDSSFNDFAGAGQFTFSGSVTGTGMSDFFLGMPSTFMQGLPNTADSAQDFVNIYFADSWKITPRLTFNFGVRWEPYLPLEVTNGQISNFDFNRFVNNVHSTVFLNAPAGFYFPGDPGFPDKTGVYKQWNHWDPRGGIAWDPTGSGKMSLRAGYAFGYVYIPGVARQDQGGSNPWGGRSTFAQTGINLSNPYATIAGGNPYPYVVTPNVTFTQAGQFITNPYNLPTPTSYSWNVSFQRQLGTSWVASVTYIGSRVQHLYINEPINYAVYIPGNCTAGQYGLFAAGPCSSTANTNARRVLSLANPSQGQYVGNMDEWWPVGNQLYNGLLTSVQKRLSRGLTISGNWTWSHCIGVFQGYDSKSDETATVPNNPTFDRGNCDSDRRHIVNLTVVDITPTFGNRIMRLLASNWQISGIYRFTSGQPLSIQDGSGVDRELSGINHQRPDQILPDPYTGLSGPSQPYFNINAFALQPLGTYGNLGWNSVVSPTFWELDASLSRIFRIHERHAIEIRADAFNLTNSFVTLVGSSPGLPSGGSTAMPGSLAVPNFDSISSNQFGLNLAAEPTRKIQFALKYTF